RYPDQVDGAGARHQIQSGAAQPGGRAGAGTDPRRVEVPSACVSWPNDVGFTPRKWNEAQYNLKRFTIMPQGGHFGAFEEPQLYLDDVRAFFKDVRSSLHILWRNHAQSENREVGLDCAVCRRGGFR